jgi:hypothetical protein
MSAETTQAPPNSGVTGDSLSAALKDRLEATFVDIQDLSGESSSALHSSPGKSPPPETDKHTC